MSQPYIPGVWARRYEQLPRPQKDEVIRKVNKIFVDRTRVTRKLDPERDKDLVRLWLRLRDAVMSGGATIPAVGAGMLALERLLMIVEGSTVASVNGRWFEVETYGSEKNAPSSPNGRTEGIAFGGLTVTIDSSKNPDVVTAFALGVNQGHTLSRARLRFSAPSLVTTLTMNNAALAAMSNKGAIFAVTFLPQTYELSVD